MVKLAHVPNGISEIKSYYGNPDKDSNWILDKDYYATLVNVKLPFPVKISWDPKTIVQNTAMHPLVVDSFVGALTDIMNFKGLQYLQDNKYDYFGGCFCFRKMVGYPALSVHSWGCAIDWCPDIGRFGSWDDQAKYPKFIAEAFMERGWDWGGNWSKKYQPDAMHFQACTGY